MRIHYDFHIHSCLSPCGDNDMTPNNIVNMALMLGLDAIALSDHNSCLNLPAIFKVAAENNLLIVPAIEVCTNEEVHLLTMFYTLEGALKFGDEIYQFLPPIQNDESIFGNQFVLDCNDNLIKSEPKLLINALTISIDKLLKIVERYGGIVIPAHVDKSSNSIISNLGFIPNDYNFTCIEVKNPPDNIKFSGKRITDSDAHYLENIALPTHFIEVQTKSIAGIIDYLKEATL